MPDEPEGDYPRSDRVPSPARWDGYLLLLLLAVAVAAASLSMIHGAAR